MNLWTFLNLTLTRIGRKCPSSTSGVIYLSLLVSAFPSPSLAMDNGVARTPPMGWMSWARFACNINCHDDPNNCISEKLYMDMADHLVADGFKAMGYNYVNIDDCWMAKQRDKHHKLQADPVRFPSGIKRLAHYVHSKGLKLGIYTDIGGKTCEKYPGSLGHFKEDAETFAEWGVDMLKVDGCNMKIDRMDLLYRQLSVALNKTKRPMVYSCSGPAYQTPKNITVDYKHYAKYCNMWRNYNDVSDSWPKILQIIDQFSNSSHIYAPVSGPGHWNDPDQILAGNFGLSYDEAKAQFALWAVLASPLFMSNDLRTLDPKIKALLMNAEVIAVGQDPLGIMGKRVFKNHTFEVWTKPIRPVSKHGKHSYAILFFNRHTLGGPQRFSIKLSTIGLDDHHGCYEFHDAFKVENRFHLCYKDYLFMMVNPSGVSMMIAKIPQQEKQADNGQT